MAEGGSNDGGNYDDAIGDDGKRNVGCEGEADHDGDDMIMVVLMMIVVLTLMMAMILMVVMV